MTLNRDFLGQNLWVTNSLNGTERRDTLQETDEMTVHSKKEQKNEKKKKKKLHLEPLWIGKGIL